MEFAILVGTFALLLVGRHALDRFARWRRLRKVRRVARGFAVLPPSKQ